RCHGARQTRAVGRGAGADLASRVRRASAQRARALDPHRARAGHQGITVVAFSDIPGPATRIALGRSGRMMFAFRDLGMLGGRRMAYSGFTLAARITLPHFSVSSAMSLPRSAGEPASTIPPRSDRRALILGSARARLISLLSLSTISAGVFLGVLTPYHWL